MPAGELAGEGGGKKQKGFIGPKPLDGGEYLDCAGREDGDVKSPLQDRKRQMRFGTFQAKRRKRR